MKKGISLITLIITIIVVIVVAGTVVLSLNNTNIIENANKGVSEQEKLSIIDSYNLILMDNMTAKETGNGEVTPINLEILAKRMGRNLKDLSRFSIDKDGNLKEGDKIIAYNLGMNGFQSGMTNNGNVSAAKVMKPILYGMTPVVVNGTNSLNPTVTSVEENNNNWYKYVAQTGDNGESIWANAKAKDGSLFVWIPRYAYKITPKKENEPAGSIDIVFIDINDKMANGQDIPAGYKIHSAFNLPKDEKLAGIWVGKYEASSNNSGDIVIKPNSTSWTNISVLEIFNNCYNMQMNSIYGFKGLKEGSTHMLKNTEWGAVAYLAHSQYGRKGAEVALNNSSSYITGTGGVEASTTNNMSGVFDMNGGAWEYVAGNYNWVIKGRGPRIITKFNELFNKDSALGTKYFDIYKDKRFDGDATTETLDWHGDYNCFVDYTETWFIRGGNFDDMPPMTGLFNYTRGSSEAYKEFSFRVCIFGENL